MGGGHNPKARVLLMQPALPHRLRPRERGKSTCGERYKWAYALMWGNVRVWTGFEALTFVIYLMQNKVVLYWSLERTAFVRTDIHVPSWVILWMLPHLILMTILRRGCSHPLSTWIGKLRPGRGWVTCLSFPHVSNWWSFRIQV